MSAQLAQVQKDVREIPKLARRITALETFRELDAAEHAQALQEHKAHVDGQTDRVTTMVGRTELGLKRLGKQMAALMEHVGAPDPPEDEEAVGGES